MAIQLKRYTKELPVLENILYYTMAICSLGMLWVIKVVIKKAVSEALMDNPSQ